MDPSAVCQYLKEHPNFTKSWFLRHVTPPVLQRWIHASELRRYGSLLDVTSGGGGGTQHGDDARLSITKNLFHKFVSGSNRETYSLRTRTELLELSQMEMFMELIRDIANELDVDILCHKILTNVSHLTQCDRGSLFLLRGSRNKRYLVSKLFDVQAGSSLDQSLHTDANQIRVPVGKGIAGMVALTQEPINIKNAYEVQQLRIVCWACTSVRCMNTCTYHLHVIYMYMSSTCH